MIAMMMVRAYKLMTQENIASLPIEFLFGPIEMEWAPFHFASGIGTGGMYIYSILNNMAMGCDVFARLYRCGRVP